jgi:sec-independent protein translocase protein TatB
MFGMGMGELLLILVVALLVVGPDKLPNAARAIGKGIRDFRKHTKDLQNTLEQDENIGEAVRELKSALRDDPIRAANRLATPRPPPPPPTPPPATPPAPGAPPELAEGEATPPALTVTPAAGTVAKNEPAPAVEANPTPRAKADG